MTRQEERNSLAAFQLITIIKILSLLSNKKKVAIVYLLNASLSYNIFECKSFNSTFIEVITLRTSECQQNIFQHEEESTNQLRMITGSRFGYVRKMKRWNVSPSFCEGLQMTTLLLLTKSPSE
ncbi:CLUMA_CG017866, isoform A [Clunio marinus]|uniref:CLUMA_CG017866, isoform A n=1 Tax=Clunio marinus TaxID=568069 RepID=A0A1J1IX77_9DIPT|nr:CLUMA_CG017866, isoform A [Clunio marinus]